MIQSVRISFVCLVFLVMHLACAPKWVGPTAPSGYYYSLRASDTVIWLMLPGSMFEDSYPRTAELIVTVKDAQGQPVNRIPVDFQVEPKWTNDATVTPQHTITQEGVARAILEAETTGFVRVMVGVENQTEAIAITVSPPPEVGTTSAD